MNRIYQAYPSLLKIFQIEACQPDQCVHATMLMHSVTDIIKGFVTSITTMQLLTVLGHILHNIPCIILFEHSSIILRLPEHL